MLLPAQRSIAQRIRLKICCRIARFRNPFFFFVFSSRSLGACLSFPVAPGGAPRLLSFLPGRAWRRSSPLARSPPLFCRVSSLYFEGWGQRHSGKNGATINPRRSPMRQLMIAASAAALIAASSIAALAAEASGAIASVDPAAGTVTLDSGQTFALPASVDAASLQVGQQVNITYEEADGKMTATEVAPAQ
jgi:hypothetical protein